MAIVGKTNRICELEMVKAFFRRLQTTLAEKRGVNVAPSGTGFAFGIHHMNPTIGTAAGPA